MSQAGIAKVDITPPEGIAFIGYHRSTGISITEERIYATAFVFTLQEKKTVLISVDNIGMLIQDTNLIRQRISRKLNISTTQVSIVFTHTHSGPATVGESQIIQSYKKMLIDNVTEVALRANQALMPAEIAWQVTRADIGVNRREKTQTGRVRMGTDTNGPVDDRIGLLMIRGAESERNLGMVVFCTAHPNVLQGDSFVLSADYPGEVVRQLHEEYECPAVIVQGSAGNVNPRFRGSPEAVKAISKMIVDAVNVMVPKLEFCPIMTLRTESDSIEIALKEIPSPEEIVQMARFAQSEWEVDTSKWRRSVTKMYDKARRRIHINLEIQLLQVNEGSFTGIPMEPFAEMALLLQEKLKNEKVFFGGYMNGYLGYLPTKEAHPFGGYEVELNPIVYGPLTGLWMPPTPDSEVQVIQKVLELHGRDFSITKKH